MYIFYYTKYKEYLWLNVLAFWVLGVVSFCVKEVIQ